MCGEELCQSLSLRERWHGIAVTERAKSEHFHEALSVSLSLDSSPRGRAFLLVKLEFMWVNTDAEMNAERGSLV